MMSIVGDIANALKLTRDGRTANKERVATFLDEVAADAKVLAEIWVELLYLHKQGRSFDELPDNLQQRMHQASYNQYGAFGTLKVFYELISSIFDGKGDRRFNEEFVYRLSGLLQSRKHAREIFDHASSPLIVRGWLDESKDIQVNDLEDVVIAMQQEAAQLRALAKYFRAKA